MKKMISLILVSFLCLSMISILALQAKAAITAENTIFSDNFESYTVGSFPSSGGWELIWDGMGPQYQIITDAYYASPTRGLQLWGNPNDWSAVVQKHFSSTSDLLGYEVSMMVSAVGYGGPGRSDYVGFFCKEAYVWGKYYAGVFFNHDTMNIIADDNSVLGTWTPGIWYNLKVLLDRDTNTYSVWIDEQLKGTSFHTGNADTNLIDAMSLQSDHPGVKDYFDDVRVFETTSAPGGPVAYWTFDEGTGSVAGDSSGNGNTGNLIGGPRWVDGVKGKAITFDGINDYMTASDSPSLDISGNQISVEFWMRPTSDIGASTPYEKLYDKGDAYHSAIGSGGLRFTIAYVHDIDTVRKTWSGGVWYHIAHVYDGSKVSIYVNGILDNSEPETGSIHVTSLPFTIAAYTFGGQWFFPGSIDEFAIYNYARTAEEIQSDYLSGTGTTLSVNVFDESGFAPASVNGFQRLAEVKVKIYDASANLVASGQSGNDGTVTFNLDSGVYTVEYGGCLYRYAATPQSTDLAHYGASLPGSKQVTVTQGINELNLYVAGLLFHEYQWGSDGGDPFQLNYIDLNSATADHETAVTVSPGQAVQAVASFWELETINVPVWWASVFGDWNPTATLANLASGVASPYSHTLYAVPFTFTAPTQPGIYHIRLNGALDYDWCNSYYTAMHPNPNLGRDMGNNVISNIDIDTVTRNVIGNYGIGTIIVSGPSAPLAVTIQSNPPTRIGTIPFQIAFTAIPSGGKGFYSILWTITSDMGTWSSTQNPLTWNFKYRGVYVVRVTATCSGTQEVATAQTIITATGTVYDAKFKLWSGIVQAGTNNPLVGLEYNNVENEGYFTISGSSVSLKTGVWVSFNGAGTLPDWLINLIGISAPWYTIEVSDAAGTVDAVPLVQLKSGTATPIDVTLPQGTPTRIGWGYMLNFSASPTTSRAIAGDCVSILFGLLGLTEAPDKVTVNKIFRAAVQHVDETAGAQLARFTELSGPEQLALVQYVLNDMLTWDYLVSLAASVAGDVGRTLIESALHANFPYITAALVLSDLGLMLDAIYRGNLWDEYYVDQITPMLYVCIDPPEIINALLITPDGTVGYSNGAWENEGFYHTDILNNTYGFGIPTTATYYSANLTLSSASGNPIPYTITFSWMNETYVLQGVIAEAKSYVIEVSETGISVYIAAKTDIKPDTLNLGATGLPITAYIELSSSLNVSDINALSILLNGTIHVDLSMPIFIGDYNNDGIADLMVKFNRAQVIGYILGHINMVELHADRSMIITLTITGEFNDGTPFKGSDTITIISPLPKYGRYAQ